MQLRDQYRAGLLEPRNHGRVFLRAEISEDFHSGRGRRPSGPEQVLDADPNHAMAYTNMAYSYRQLGNYKKAIGLYNKALALQPNLAEAHEYLGAALAAAGKIADAKRHLAILEKLNPNFAEELRAEIAKHERRS